MGSDEDPLDGDSIKLARDVYEIASRHLLHVQCDPYAIGPEFDTSDARTFAALRLLRRGSDATGALLKLPPPWRNVNPDGTVRTRVEGPRAYTESPGCIKNDLITLGSIGVLFYVSGINADEIEREERIARAALPEGPEEDAREVLTEGEFNAFCRRASRAESARFWAAVARDHAGPLDIEALREFLSTLTAGTRMGLWVAEFGKPVLAEVIAHDAGDGRAVRSLLLGDLTRDTVLDVSSVLDRLAATRRLSNCAAPETDPKPPAEPATGVDPDSTSAAVEMCVPAYKPVDREILFLLLTLGTTEGMTKEAIIADLDKPEKSVASEATIGRAIQRLSRNGDIESTAAGYRIAPKRRAAVDGWLNPGKW